MTMKARRNGLAGVVSAAVVGALAVAALAAVGGAGPEEAGRAAPDATRVNGVGAGEIGV